MIKLPAQETNAGAIDRSRIATFIPDSLSYIGDIHKNDSIEELSFIVDSLTADSVAPKKVSKNAITDKVDYKSQDSIIFNLKDKKAYLYNTAEIHYQNITLKANYVETSFQTKLIEAKGVPDSTGKLQGNPEFSEGDQNYKAKEMTYNFESKKGIIHDIITNEGEGYLHGYKVKKVDENIMYLSGGCYTTCDHEEPHFGIEFRKGKMITGDKILTGPAYLSIENVPTPLVLPFAYFPITKSRKSGLIMPAPGYANNRGYFLKRGGYYFALSDYYDLSVTGSIYSNLSWEGNAKSNYYKRYKYRGEANIIYSANKQGLRGLPDYGESKDFSVRWSHWQDPKANPKGNFSASVEFVSSNFGKWANDVNDYIKNTTSSSISYRRSLNSKFYFTTDLRESYNSLSKIYEFHLPSFSLNMSSPFYPFRRKKSAGNHKWYEDINIRYTMTGTNKISSPDSTLFDAGIWNKMSNGIQHSIPISSSIRVFKHFNWDNDIQYTERWYLKSIRKDWNLDSNRLEVDTVSKFITNRNASFSTSLGTTIYGMANFKSNYIKAVRHILKPSVGFTYTPNFGSANLGYWRTYNNPTGLSTKYSIFERSVYGGPPGQESGMITFGLGNRLEMKVRSKSDSIHGTKKLMLIEDLLARMSYDVAADSMKLSPLSISGRTTLFHRLTVNYSGIFHPYCRDSLGNYYNEMLWTKEKKLFTLTDATWTFNLNWSLNSNSTQKTPPPAVVEQQNTATPFLNPFNNPNEILGNTVDFNVPWNLNISYYLIYNDKYITKDQKYKGETSQTIDITGDFNLTPKWKIGFRSGYDLKMKEVKYTSIDIYLDLHCWEIRGNWVPISANGFRNSWNFTVNVKAGSLKDVIKYKKESSFRDTQPYL